jgi:hypothetical protein
MSASNQHPRIDESLHEAAQEPVQEELPGYAADAPPLRADDYDPVWSEQAQMPPSEAVAQSDIERIEQILASEHFRMQQRRRPRDFVAPPPPPAEEKRSGVPWAIGTFIVLVAASAGAAYYATENGSAESVARFAALFASAPRTEAEPSVPVAQKAASAETPAAHTRLLVKGANADSTDQILLGVVLDGPGDGLNALVSGLAPGSTLTAGRRWGDTGWIVPATELATTYLRPPAGFSGTMEYSVALRRADNSVIDRQSMRLQWTAAEPPPPATQAKAPEPPATQAKAPEPPATQAKASEPPAPAPASPPPAQSRKLSTDEIAGMVARGEELLIQGDIASARLLLQRAADAQDARAAFALASTYDPIELKRLRVYGATADVKQARDWYEKAKVYGSREAPKRLELLASQFR